jgi:hypothetical protein
VSAADPEAAYFQAVEEFFVSRRGDPLMLSNADWLLVRRWREQGLPLRVVLRGITDALDAHAHSWGRERKVGSLRYCQAEVDRARERWERALADGTDEGHDLGGSLRSLAAALAGARLGSAAAAVAARVSGELERLIASAGRPRDVEPSLQAAEAELLAALAHDDPQVAGELARTVDAALAPYRSRLPGPVFASLRAQSLARETLARYGLPRLSLFEG